MKKLVIVLFLILLCQIVFAARFIVPDDYATIQSAIDATSETDSVFIKTGVYTGPGNVDLTFSGKNIVVYCASAVTIDCNGSVEEPHVAFLLDNNETNASKISGARIINAYAPGFSGAITLLHASVTIQHCIIENNQIPGIVFSNWSTPGIIHNTTIKNNSEGIGYTGADMTISNSHIIGNNGNGITSRSKIFIQNSVIAYNGAIGLSNINGVSQPVSIDNCTFAFNDVGLHFETELPKADVMATADISNSIFAYNQTGIRTSMALITMACSDMYGNTVSNFDGPDPGILTTNGNFTTDPLFCDTVTQFLYLTTGSPCLSENNSCMVQIGALGWHECECCEGIRGNIDNDANDNIDIADLVWLVSYMFTGGPGPVCEVEADLNDDGWWDIADLVYLINYMFVFDSPAPFPCPYIN